jgi:hypothetical protein
MRLNEQPATQAEVKHDKKKSGNGAAKHPREAFINCGPYVRVQKRKAHQHSLRAIPRVDVILAKFRVLKGL